MSAQIRSSQSPNNQTLEDQVLSYIWISLGYHEFERCDFEFLRGKFMLSLPVSVNTLQTFVGVDGSIMARTNQNRRMHGGFYLEVERTKGQHHGRWVTHNIVKLRLTEHYLSFLRSGGENGNLRHPSRAEMDIIQSIWTYVVQWVTELCYMRPIPLDDWFEMNDHLAKAGLDPNLTSSHKANAMSLLNLAWKSTKSDDTTQLLEGNAFFQERQRAIEQILGILRDAVQDMQDPSGKAKEALSHWFVCRLMKWKVLKREDRLALSVHVWKAVLDEWISRLQPWIQDSSRVAKSEGRSLVESGIDDWAKWTMMQKDFTNINH